MSSAWLLPEHIADVLPAQARHIEELRRSLLDRARSYGFELVMPPLLEHLESLLSGTGHELDLRTFKLVDQLSGRTLGLRADTTPQVARIDAHLLNREGVTRLCYCGPVLHTRPAGLQATREPLQFGAEIYGHAGLEADLEVQDLALDCLHAAGVDGLLARPGRCAHRARRAGRRGRSTRAQLQAVVAALSPRRTPRRSRRLSPGLPGRGASRPAGAARRCTAASRCWPPRAACCRRAPLIGAALDDLRLAGRRTCERGAPDGAASASIWPT